MGYLITTSDDGRPHTTSHQFAVAETNDGALLTCPAGRTTTRNVEARPLVALLWPPSEVDGYSLIVDASAAVDNGQVTITPTTAVLHRPAPGGGNDCAAPGSV